MPSRQDVTQQTETAATQVLVVADDFTGANDAGVGLARRGAQANVLFDTHKLHAGLLRDVVVINTDSRAVDAREAAARTARAVAAWRQAGGRGWMMKKVDSTLRGNLGAEIEAALLAADLPLALVATASPALGRVVRDGLVWVNQHVLTATEFASDPKTPVCSAAVGERLAEQSALRQAEIHVSELRRGDLVGRLQQLINGGVRLAIIDAETAQDLDAIVAAAAQLPVKPLLVGSAGLSDALALRLRFAPAPTPRLLAVVGSMSEIAQRQLHIASQQRDVSLIDIDIRQLLSGVDAQWIEQAVAALRAGRHCLIHTCLDEHERFDVERLCRQQGLARAQLGEAISRRLGALTRGIVERQLPGGLYLSGGDIAIAVANALGASGFHIQGQVAACVPRGRLLDSIVGDIPVMTKAGGFGNDATLLDVLRFIEESVSE